MNRIGIIGENSVEYINALIDIWNNGDCAVLIDWRIPFDTAIQMMKEASVQKCYIEKKIFEEVESNICKEICFEVFERINNNAQLVGDEIFSKFKENYSENEAIVLYSSGTTGKAKGIILSHFAINTNADAIINYMKPTKNDCIYIAKTISHSSTVTGEFLVALKTKTKLVIAPTIVPPRFTLNNISKFNVTIICLNPTMLSMYANEYLRTLYNLKSLRSIYVSGAVLNDKVYNLAHKVFENIPIYNVYGLSEAGPRVCAQRIESCKNNSVGIPIQGIKVVISDEEGNEVKQGKRGIIHVNTPSRFNGYITGIEKIKSIYEDWINTGDIGYWDEDGELNIINRVDDVININSHKIYPNDIEKKILSLDGIQDCIVIPFSVDGIEPKLCCLYIGDTVDKRQIKKYLQNCIMYYEIPEIFLSVNEIPKNKNGKIDVAKIKMLLEDVINK